MFHGGITRIVAIATDLAIVFVVAQVVVLARDSTTCFLEQLAAGTSCVEASVGLQTFPRFGCFGDLLVSLLQLIELVIQSVKRG